MYYLALGLSLLVSVYFWLKYKYSYWERRSVKSPNTIPFFGNFAKVLMINETVTEFTKKVYNNYPDEPFVGIYQGLIPGLLIRDNKIINHILIKDFHIFQNRGGIINDDTFSQNLFSAEGDRWRVLRQKLTPIFTSGKLKNMIPLISRCVNDYITYIDNLVKYNKDIEIRELVSKYTLEAIGACAFGVDMKTFTEENNLFQETAKKFNSPALFRRVLQILAFFVPGVAIFIEKYLYLKVRDDTLKEFFMQLVNKIVNEREGHPKLRKDFMDLMIELKEQGKATRQDVDKSIEIDIDVELIAAQASVFYVAGFETSAATMSFLMYELALNPNIQEKATKEVKEIIKKHNGVLSYEAIKEMPYLTACFDETLRKYPVVGQLVRKSLDNYTLPGTKLTIEKNTSVLIPVAALHHDPQHYKDPMVFKPERFLGDARNSIPHCTYLPFGEGPRNCIGLRFAKVQSMMGIAAFLDKFRVDPSSKTPSALKYSRRTLILTADHGIWLKISRRT